MTEDEVFVGLGYLTAATGPWADVNVEAYASDLQELPEGVAFITACRRLAREWRDSRRPLIAEIRDAYRVEQGMVGISRPDREHCGGDGWINVDPLADQANPPEGIDRRSFPCPTCNPYLSDLYTAADASLWRRWLDGIPLHELHPNITWNQRLRREEPDRPMPEPYKVERFLIPDDEQPVSAARGMEIARAAYEQYCAEQGRAPKLDYFSAAVAKALARPKPPPAG